MAEQLRAYSAWIWLLAALVVIAALKIVTAQPAQPPPPLSVTSDRPDGMLAAYQWLGRLGYRVERESTGAVGLNRLQAGKDTLMVVSPQATFSPQLARSVLHWVWDGGRLVLGTDGTAGEALLSRLKVRMSFILPGAMSVRQPLLLAPPAASLSGVAGAVARGSPGAVTVASAPGGAALLRLPVGHGVAWVLTAPTVFDNATIRQGDNRRLLLNLAGRPPARVGFDEYRAPAGGSPSIPTDWLIQTPWGVAVIFTVVLLALYRWLSGWRLGPPLIPLSDRYRPLSEYVVSMGGLLQRGKERKGVLRMYQATLERELKNRLGPEYRIALDAGTRRRVDELLAVPEQLSEEELMRRAAEIVQCEDDLARVRL